MINPAKCQINYSRDADWQVTLQWADQRTGVGFDFTGSTYTMEIASGGQTHASVGSGITIDHSEEAQGKLTITIAKETLPLGEHAFNLWNDGTLLEKLAFGPVISTKGA